MDTARTLRLLPLLLLTALAAGVGPTSGAGAATTASLAASGGGSMSLGSSAGTFGSRTTLTRDPADPTMVVDYNAVSAGGESATGRRRAFAIFDVPVPAAPFTGAVLVLEIAGRSGPSAPGSLAVHDVTSDLAEFDRSISETRGFRPCCPFGNFGAIPSLPLWDDLADGARYGGAPAADLAGGQPIVLVPLSAPALADVNAAAGGRFAVGLSISGCPGETSNVACTVTIGAAHLALISGAVAPPALRCLGADGPAVGEVVALGDRFNLMDAAAGVGLVGRPSRLCSAVGVAGAAPATAGLAPVPAADAHLTLYSTPVLPRGRARDVAVRNRFGDQVLTTFGLALWLGVPSTLDGAPPAGGLDHFQCHLVSGAPVGETVDLDGPDGPELGVDVGHPVALCNPTFVVRAGGGADPVVVTSMENPEELLTCYSTPAAPLRGTVVATDPFGTAELALGAADTLCVPTTAR